MGESSTNDSCEEKVFQGYYLGVLSSGKGHNKDFVHSKYVGQSPVAACFDLSCIQSFQHSTRGVLKAGMEYRTLSGV
jgi:hypothetical protein